MNINRAGLTIMLPSYVELVDRFFAAASNGNVHMLANCIRDGVCINTLTTSGEHVLHVALQNGQQGMIITLLTHPALNVEVVDRQGRTPLMAAVHLDATEIVRLLLADPRVNPNVTELPDRSTILHVAIRRRNLILVQAILDSRRVDINAQTEEETIESDSALHLAIQERDMGILRALLLAGANVELEDLRESTPLRLCIDMDYFDPINLLLQYNANVHTENANFETLYHAAAISGQMHLLHWLMRTDIDVNLQANDGHTALHMASSQGHHDVVATLLTHPLINPFLTNNRGQTAYDVAYNQEVRDVF